jgi:hypothetical protein
MFYLTGLSEGKIINLKRLLKCNNYILEARKELYHVPNLS